MKIFSAILGILLFSAGVGAQDNTNPYCGQGNVPSGGADGPAVLMQRCMFTQISSTPSSNYPKLIKPTDDLQTALNTAMPGDVLLVDPLTSFSINGKLILPNGTASQWITIRTSSSFIPDEYTKITPAFASYLPKLIVSMSNASITGGQYVRLIGFEVTRPEGTGIVYNLFSGLGHDVILDRLYIHGTHSDETNRGVILNDASNITVMNSWFEDFHCFAIVGACGDSQAISGGGSTSSDGNFKIVNNHLEAAGQSILFGGSPASVVPTDIVVAYNDLIKPMSWNPKDTSYNPVSGHDGLPHPWIVKNHLELKNASRVLIEGNRLQNIWGGFTQVGASILLTAKNQAGANGASVCPICAVTDVTIRYNYLSFAAQALQIGCSQGGNGGWPAECARYSIHDNLFDHLQYQTCYSCGSFTNLIGGGGPTVLHDLVVDHNTFQNDGWIGYNGVWGATTGVTGFLTLSSPIPGSIPQELNINWTNNIFDVGNSGAYSSGGGTSNCWSLPGTLKQKFASCWPSGSFTGNQFVTTVTFRYGILPWPDGNTGNPAAGENIDLVNTALNKRR